MNDANLTTTAEKALKCSHCGCCHDLALARAQVAHAEVS